MLCFRGPLQLLEGPLRALGAARRGGDELQDRVLALLEVVVVRPFA